MSKLLDSATMSVDGFIAGVEGDMSWLTEHLGAASPRVDDLMADIGALLIGKRTFAGDDPTRAPTRRARSAAGGMARRSS
jgi:riboflavin biosynthesis pyrimidine reductase